MKLSTSNWLSKAIALPLFMAIINISMAVSAEQIDRSRSRVVDSLPVLKNLKIPIPVSAPEISADDIDSSTLAPIWSNSDRQNSAPTGTKKTAHKSKAKKLAHTNDNYSTALSLDNQPDNKIDPSSKRIKLVATNSEIAITTNTVGRSKIVVKNSSKLKPSYKQRLAAGSRSPFGGSYLRLVRDPNRQTNAIGNPIYVLEAYVNGQRYRTFNAVSGTATTQLADRNLGNNFAPLPDGLYAVGEVGAGTLPEVGRTFISIVPKFETGRVELGIHLDRSFNKSNGYDGTAGCIGITNIADRDAVNEFVNKYRPRNLLVKILNSDDRRLIQE